MLLTLRVRYHDDEVRRRAPLRRKLAGDCGFDLYNASNSSVLIPPRQCRQVPAGISIKLPDGWCAFCKPRSSTFARRGLIVMAGVIDQGYTGPVYSFVWNPGINGQDKPVVVQPWERLSQLVLVPVPEVIVGAVEELPETERGSRGFGSTGA